MNFLHRYQSASKPVETCVVASGGFGRSFVAQAQAACAAGQYIAVADVQHVMLTSKEVESVVGPGLARRAQAMGRPELSSTMRMWSLILSLNGSVCGALRTPSFFDHWRQHVHSH